jgi:uncharacterized damage-inducible protein DinB
MDRRALTELLRGRGAHADPIACVEDISAELAARHVDGFPHSIAELVFHMNFWMDYDLRRLRGERPKYPEHNAESFPARVSSLEPMEWDRLRLEFESLLGEHERLAELSPSDLQRSVEATNERHNELSSTREAMLWQTVVHNSYHVGQIAMIRQALGVWPPKAGGDTW